MSTPNKDSNALQVLADTASDDELRNRYDASKNSGQSPVENRDHDSSPSYGKEYDNSGGRGSVDSDTSSSVKKSGYKARKDGERKGKWLEEEEEYTTRVIHHYSSGLITLPEGKTLRTFLAEKLNCSAMRITKKFAGASCLSKKIHTLCERPQFTPQEIEAARIEIERLEERFLLRLEHGPGVVLPPVERKAPVSLGSSALSQYQNSYKPGQSAVPSSMNSTQTVPQNSNAQAYLALLAYNAQLAAASNPSASLSYPPPQQSDTMKHQTPPVQPPLPAAPVPPPSFDLQTLLQQNNRAQPTNTPPENNLSQQLTQSLVSQLLNQLQTLATVSPSTITQLHRQLFTTTPAPPPPSSSSQGPAAGMDIAALLQNAQATSQPPRSNYAANNNVQQFLPQVPKQNIPTLNQGSAYVGNQFARHLAPQVPSQVASNNPKPPTTTSVEDLLAQLKKGHDEALSKARKESKKRKKDMYSLSSHSSSNLTNGSIETENQKQLRYERATVVSNESGSGSKNPNDTEGSSSSADLIPSDTAKGSDSSSNTSCSDEERDSRRGPLRKRFKGSRNGGMTQRALQDHDERMARNGI